MSTDRRSVSYDPRYEGIYQRGGTDPVQEPQVRRTEHLSPEAPSRSPQQTDPYDRSAADHSAALSSPASPSHAPSERQQADNGPGASNPSAIRELGAPPEVPGTDGALARARNPFDLWVWVVAGVLTALGIYFISAPIVFAEAYAEAMMSQSGSNPYVNPWYNYTVNLAPPMILLGVGTAVVQLVILSIRHTLRAR